MLDDNEANAYETGVGTWDSYVSDMANLND